MTTTAAGAPVRRVDRREVVLTGGLFALAALSWWITSDRMDGMATGPTTDLGGLGFYAGVWVVMMAAMMFPSVWPVVAMYDRVRAGHGAKRDSTALVVGGYLVAWTAWGLLAFGALELGRALLGEFLPWDGAGRWVAAGVLAGAAVYQLTPLKNACLARCRGPLMFVMENWRTGRAGALRMGVVHGAWCVGCCWALMAALFALGVMSLGWMAFVAALIAAEKLLPSRRLANLGIAALLTLIALALAIDPSLVPATPDGASMSSDEAMPSMR